MSICYSYLSKGNTAEAFAESAKNKNKEDFIMKKLTAKFAELVKEYYESFSADFRR